jgi:hypothetical protein
LIIEPLSTRSEQLIHRATSLVSLHLWAPRLTHSICSCDQ